MLIGQPIGASFTSVVKSAARTAAGVAQDPRVQRAAVAAAQAYAPEKYAQVTEYAQRAQRVRGAWRGQPGMRPPPMQQQQMMPMPESMPEDFPPPAAAPVQKGNMLGIAAIIGAGVVIFLLLRNR